MNLEDPASFQDMPNAQPAPQSQKSFGRAIGELAEYSRKIMQVISREIKSESRSIAVEQWSLASKKLDIFAQALREAAGKLRESESYSLANILEAGSETTMGLSNNIRETKPEMIIGEVQNFARKQPVVFLGTALVAGILLGQLFSTFSEGDGTDREFPSTKEPTIEFSPPNNEGEYYVSH